MKSGIEEGKELILKILLLNLMTKMVVSIKSLMNLINYLIKIRYFLRQIIISLRVNRYKNMVNLDL